jgi:hypothetical protein
VSTEVKAGQVVTDDKTTITVDAKTNAKSTTVVCPDWLKKRNRCPTG